MTDTATVFSDANLVEAARRVLDAWQEWEAFPLDDAARNDCVRELHRLEQYVSDREQTHAAAREAAQAAAHSLTSHDGQYVCTKCDKTGGMPYASEWQTPCEPVEVAS